MRADGGRATKDRDASQRSFLLPEPFNVPALQTRCLKLCPPRTYGEFLREPGQHANSPPGMSACESSDGEEESSEGRRRAGAAVGRVCILVFCLDMA